MRRAWRLHAAAVVGALVSLVLAAPALANHSTTERLSIGPAGGNGAKFSDFEGASSDGSHAFFQTDEQLTGTDLDAQQDVYERTGTTTNLVSTGPTGGNGAFGALFWDVSADGTKAVFDTKESLVSADTDSSIDLYQRSAGTTTLLSLGSSGGNGAFDVLFVGASIDGAHVFFQTKESLVSGDTDSSVDVYDFSGAAPSLVSTGPAGGNLAFDVTFGGSSTDGTRVFFHTAEKLVTSDTDSVQDVYQRTGGVTTLLSTGPSGGNGAFPAAYAGASANGTMVFFDTAEKLRPGDTDSSTDIYQRSGTTTALVSVSGTGGNGAFAAFFAGASADGSHVLFHTREVLAPGDTDARFDVYDRTGGTTTTLMSIGPAGGNGNVDAFLRGLSSDASILFFDTAESIVSADTDSFKDIYQRSGGTTTLVSTGFASTNAPTDALFRGNSSDGTRVFFTTSEVLLAGDTDTSVDVYERFDDEATLISIGPTGGNGAFPATYGGASDSGGKVFFATDESLTVDDTDAFGDVYSSSVVPGFPRPKGASPFSVALVPAFAECLVPNTSHGPPDLPGGSNPDASCAPPSQASGQLTVGSPDANGKGAKFAGRVNFKAMLGNPSTPADEADIAITATLSDVRRKSDLTDYPGSLKATTTLRLTDRANGSTLTGTVTDIPLSFPIACGVTPDTTIGSSCSATTTGDVITGGGVKESLRSVWELSQIQVLDGGADSNPNTDPNTVFATEGYFVP